MLDQRLGSLREAGRARRIGGRQRISNVLDQDDRVRRAEPIVRVDVGPLAVTAFRCTQFDTGAHVVKAIGSPDRIQCVGLAKSPVRHR